jgi:hypothetical protein
MLITDCTAPSYETLRPMKPLSTPTFPVYPKLAETLAATETHPDPTVAHVLGTCAGYAYSDAATVAMIMARMGLNDNHCRMIAESVDVMFIRSTSFLLQSHDGRVLILCYRGTEPVNLINWLTDFDTHPEKVAFSLPDTPGTFGVHAGFYRNVRATRYEAVASLERALHGQSVLAKGGSMPNPLEALYITGHSLGAAMAALMAVMLKTEPAYAPIGEKLKAVYTYGQPMIGTPAFAGACAADPFLGKSVIRYIYGHDVVPQLPPTASGPFAHFGPEWQYHRKGDAGSWIHNSQPTKQLRNILEVLGSPLSLLGGPFRLLRNVPFRASVEDHLPQHYIPALTPPGVRSEFGD